MVHGIAELEIAALVLLRAAPLIVAGLLVQHWVFRSLRFPYSAPGRLLALGANAILAAVTTLLLCVVSPAFMRDLLILDLLESLAFQPALIGVIVATTVVTLWCLRTRSVVTS